MLKAPNWARRLFGGAPESNAPLFEAALEHYRAVLAARPITAKTAEGKLTALRYLGALRGRPVDTIRPFEVAQAVRQVHDAGMWVTSRAALGAARDLFNEALLMGWIDINPALHVKRLPAPVRRQRMTIEQFAAVYEYGRAHYPPWFAVCLRLALVTAQRRSDLVRLRFDNVREGHLFVEQYKTGARVAIPLALRLDALGCTVGDVIDECRSYAPTDGDLLLRTAARPRRKIHPQSITNRFWTARKAVLAHTGPGTPPAFHEIRSLSERLYRAQGVDTRTLLGHKHRHMTDVYNDERGLNSGKWKVVELPKIRSNEP